MTRPYYAGGINLKDIMATFNSPKYDELSVTAAAGLSRFENARIRLLAETEGLQELIDGQVAGAELKAAGQDKYTKSQTNNAAKMAFSEVVGSALGSIKMPGSGGGIGTDTMGASDLDAFGRSAADQRTLSSGGFIDHGYIG